MSPEPHKQHPDWQTVDRLLVWYETDLTPSLSVQITEPLKQALPHLQITVWEGRDWSDPKTLEWLSNKGFDAVIVFTLPGRSPYRIAYLCYLAGIPIRVGQSCEFGGGVLSHCIPTLPEKTDPIQYHLHLLQHSGVPTSQFLACSL